MLKKIELIFWITVIVSAILFLLKFPTGNSMLVVSMGILSFYYMYLSFAILNGISGRNIFKRSSYAAISNTRIIGSVALGLCFSLSLVSLLFAVMIWPNFKINAIVSGVGMLLASGIGIYQYQLGRESYYLEILKRTSVFILICAFTIWLPKYGVLEWKYEGNDNYIEAFKARNENPSDPKLLENFEKAREEMFKASEN